MSVLREPSVPRTWPEATHPTPEQYADWYVQLTREERVTLAEVLLRDNEVAVACWQRDHEGRIEWLENQLRAKVAEAEQATKDAKQVMHAFQSLAEERDALREKAWMYDELCK